MGLLGPTHTVDRLYLLLSDSFQPMSHMAPIVTDNLPPNRHEHCTNAQCTLGQDDLPISRSAQGAYNDARYDLYRTTLKQQVCAVLWLPHPCTCWTCPDKQRTVCGPCCQIRYRSDIDFAGHEMCTSKGSAQNIMSQDNCPQRSSLGKRNHNAPHRFLPGHLS